MVDPLKSFEKENTVFRLDVLLDLHVFFWGLFSHKKSQEATSYLNYGAKSQEVGSLRCFLADHAPWDVALSFKSLEDKDSTDLWSTR